MHLPPVDNSLFQVQTFSDRPGYERTSSSLWKQREEHCAKIIQTAWRDHYQKTKSKRKGRQQVPNGKQVNARNDGKKLIEVQPSPSPEN